MSSTNIQIAVKVRPLVEKELKDKLGPSWLVQENSIVQIDNAHNFIGDPYSFDHIFDQHTSNKEVYDSVAKPLVMSFLQGINSTIFAYGQTSSGKTHTMLGAKHVPGLIEYIVKDIVKHIEETDTKNFLLRCSYVEIYNEKINDLLDTKAKDLKIREDYAQMVHINAKEEVIRELNELFSIMRKGMKTRKIGCTDMNERSSRSHTIFKLVIQSQNKDSEGSYTESSLSLVDLAGSERVGQMKMKAERQAEGVSINKSLTTLGLVIRKLSENEQFINYRDSKLTRLLQYSLGGNSRTLIICTITVATAEETKSTLEFAQRAKYVKNRPIINKKVTDKDQLKQYAHLCQNYKNQIEKLRLEKLDRENTINALEDKITNIRLFSPGSWENFTKTPQRRHTLGNFKPFMTKPLTPIVDIEESDESSNEEYLVEHDLPAKLDVPFTREEDKENINFDTEPIASTPSKPFCIQNTSKAHKTLSPVLILQNRCLEDPSDSLNTFTNYEKQLLGQHDEIKELKDLTERLRNENIDLRTRNIKESQLNSKMAERDKEIFDQLVFLESILEEKPVEGIRRKSLDTITEEDVEMISGQIVPTSSVEILDQLTDETQKNRKASEKCANLSEENRLFKLQLDDNQIESSRNASYTDTKEKLAAFSTENEKLRNQLDIRNITINQLETCIAQHKEVKEAELEIPVKKIKQLSNEKEKVHRILSETQQLEQDLARQLKGECDINLQNELDSLTKEVDELRQLAEYNTFKIGELEEENQNLKVELEEKRHWENELKENYDARHKQLKENLSQLEKQNLELRQRLNSNDTLQAKLNQYILDSKILKGQCDSSEIELNDLKIQLNTKVAILEEKTTENVSLIKENAELKNQFNVLSHQHMSLKDIQDEERVKHSYLKLQVDELSNDKISMNLQLTKLSTDLNTNHQEIKELRDALEGQGEELKLAEKDREKLLEKLRISVQDLLDINRHLEKRSEQLSHLKEKYDALEVKFFDCKDALKNKAQEVDNYVKSTEHLNSLLGSSEVLSLNKYTELKSKLNSPILELDQAQYENKLKAASEDIQMLKLNMLDVSSVQAECEKYKIKLQEVYNNYEQNVKLKKTVATLTDEKQILENQLSKSEDRFILLEQMLNQLSGNENHLKQELYTCKQDVNALKSQLDLKKIQIVSLSKKLLFSETEVNNLQAKVKDLISYKKRMQDKISDGTLKEMSVPKLSDEGRPLLPNDLRKIKRQSIHDQRRGLMLDSGDSLELINTVCSDCKELKTKLCITEDQNKMLQVEVEKLKKENTFLDNENEDMLKIINEMKTSENDLYNRLQSCEKSMGCCDTNQLSLLQIKYNEIVTSKTELEKQLLQNKKSIQKHKKQITDMESNYLDNEYRQLKVIKDLRGKLENHQSKVSRTSMEDKETQATCDLHEKYKTLKKLAQIRRQEGNFLRAKLNLPADCAVLPGDVQRQPTNV